MIRLYVHAITRRMKTILEVPADLRESVLAALPQSDRDRMDALLRRGGEEDDGDSV